MSKAKEFKWGDKVMIRVADNYNTHRWERAIVCGEFVQVRCEGGGLDMVSKKNDIKVGWANGDD